MRSLKKSLCSRFNWTLFWTSMVCHDMRQSWGCMNMMVTGKVHKTRMQWTCAVNWDLIGTLCLEDSKALYNAIRLMILHKSIKCVTPIIWGRSKCTRDLTSGIEISICCSLNVIFNNHLYEKKSTQIKRYSRMSVRSVREKATYSFQVFSLRYVPKLFRILTTYKQHNRLNGYLLKSKLNWIKVLSGK
jgi:hypothetical protein